MLIQNKAKYSDYNLGHSVRHSGVVSVIKSKKWFGTKLRDLRDSSSLTPPDWSNCKAGKEQCFVEADGLI